MPTIRLNPLLATTTSPGFIRWVNAQMDDAPPPFSPVLMRASRTSSRDLKSRKSLSPNHPMQMDPLSRHSFQNLAFLPAMRFGC